MATLGLPPGVAIAVSGGVQPVSPSGLHMPGGETRHAKFEIA